MNIYNVGYCLLHDENMYIDRIDSRIDPSCILIGR